MQKAISDRVNTKFHRMLQRLNEDPGPHRTKFWRLLRNLSRKRVGTSTICTADGPLLMAREKCDAFAQHFQVIGDAAPTNRGLTLSARISRSVTEVRTLSLEPNPIPTISRRDVTLSLQSDVLNVVKLLDWIGPFTCWYLCTTHVSD